MMDEHWTMTPEGHKYAAAAGPFCFLTTENGEERDIQGVSLEQQRWVFVKVLSGETGGPIR